MYCTFMWASEIILATEAKDKITGAMLCYEAGLNNCLSWRQRHSRASVCYVVW